MPPVSRTHPSSAPSTPYRARTTSAVVDVTLLSSPTTSEPGRRRAASSSTSPYPQSRQAVEAARTASHNQQRVRRVLAEIDWWTVMSGQRPDDEDDEQEEEEAEDQNLFLANVQQVVFDDVENESTEEHSMLAPSSLAASSEDGSQFADDDCEDTATAHDEHSNIALLEETSLLGPAIILTEDTVRPSRDEQENTRPPSPFFPTTLPPLSPLLAREAAEPSRQPRDPTGMFASSFRGGNTIAWHLPPSRSKPSTLSAFRRALGVAPGSVSDNILREALAPVVNTNAIASTGVSVPAGAAVAAANPTAAPVVTCGSAISLAQELGKMSDSRLLRETGPLVASLQ